MLYDHWHDSLYRKKRIIQSLPISNQHAQSLSVIAVLADGNKLQTVQRAKDYPTAIIDYFTDRFLSRFLLKVCSIMTGECYDDCNVAAKRTAD